MVKLAIKKYRLKLDSIFAMADKIEESTELKILEREKIYEGVFLDAFKNYEFTIEQLFVCGMLSGETIRRKKFNPYVKPRNAKHAMEVMLMEKDFLDWTKPDNVITRAEAYFSNHAIITDCIKQNKAFLEQARKIRNAIAHTSEEANRQFYNVVSTVWGTKPMMRKSPGWFLSQNIQASGSYIKVLRQYLNHFSNLSTYFI